MRLVFCLFADSIELLPNHAFRNLVKNNRQSPIAFNRILPTLFAAMSEEDSFFGADVIPYFNGGLFSDKTTIALNYADLGILNSAASHDWSHIEPVIFGTLFERSLDADKRSMIGAHYTSADDILLLIEPVVMAPLQRRWQVVRQSVLDALAAESPASATNPGAPSPPSSSFNNRPLSSFDEVGGSASALRSKARKSTQPALKLRRPALDLLQAWAAEITRVRILDPACGSGNFLYIALKRLLDLWHDARVFGIEHGLALSLDPIPHPGQLFGIEIDLYAHEIASIVVWIGFLQWKRDHSIIDQRSPVLQKLSNIEHADAIMRYDANNKPYEPEWPQADYIVGNPPFLGDKKMRSELDIEPHTHYVDDLRTLYDGRIPGGADLVTYWFEKARAMILHHQVGRAGLLATQAIRGGANRKVLDRIKQSGDIFFAYADKNWSLDGAVVHVSIIGFDDGTDGCRQLDGESVDLINANLTTGLNLNSAGSLKENGNICFTGTQRGGPFDVSPEEAAKLLRAPINPNGRPNSDVVRPWINASDITGRSRNKFIIDFGTDTTKARAALYEWPFEYALKYVKPFRDTVRRDAYREKWWLFQEARPGLRKAFEHLERFIATPLVSKHRIFIFLSTRVMAENLVITLARDDDYFFGVLHSRPHELWARAQGTQLREADSALRYTASTTFDTFPFPWPPNYEPSETDSPLVAAIASAARNLVKLRDAWLYPPGISESDLKKRTLTNLYNERPTWLADAHRTLDEAVFAAYGWPLEVDGNALTTSEILARLLALNHQRAAASPAPPQKAERKASRDTPAPA